MKNKRLILIQAGVGVLLLIPLIAMQFTKEVDWNIFDFLIMGILLSGTGFLCELVLRKAKSTQSRILICGLVIFLFLLTWIELAVGIFGTPFAGSWGVKCIQLPGLNSSARRFCYLSFQWLWQVVFKHNRKAVVWTMIKMIYLNSMNLLNHANQLNHSSDKMLHQSAEFPSICPTVHSVSCD